MRNTPVTPHEVENSIDRESVDHHVGTINRMLCDGRRTYATSLISDGWVLREVVREFEGAGWHVEQVADFRDGDFLRFSGPR